MNSGCWDVELNLCKKVNWQCHLLASSGSQQFKQKNSQSGWGFSMWPVWNHSEHWKHLKIHEWKSRRLTSLCKEVNWYCHLLASFHCQQFELLQQEHFEIEQNLISKRIMEWNKEEEKTKQKHLEMKTSQIDCAIFKLLLHVGNLIFHLLCLEWSGVEGVV